MTQEQALHALKSMFPTDAKFLAVSRERFIGREHGQMNTFTLWRFRSDSELLASSHVSYDQALAELAAKTDPLWTYSDQPFDDEVAA